VPFEFIDVPISNLSLDAGNNPWICEVSRDMNVRPDEITELWYHGVIPDIYKTREEDAPIATKHRIVECSLYSPSRSTRIWTECSVCSIRN
jgi:hypothetical protein